MLGKGGKVAAAAVGRPIYSFPELRNADILQCMEDLHIPLGEAELSKPSPQTVQRIFEAFADIFMGLGPDQLGQQPSFAVVEELEHPDLHLDAISLLSFHRVLTRLMVHVGINDFSLRDMIRPEAPRLRLILSAVINFAKFREEQLSVFEDFSRRADEAATSRARLAKRRDEIAIKVAKIRARYESQEGALRTVKEETTQLIQKLRDLKKEQTALSARLDEAKEAKAEISSKSNQTQFLLASIKQECNKLKSRIVHSPEKLLQIIEEMATNIAAEKAALTALERKSRDLQMKVEALAHLEGELERTLKGMELLNGDFKKRDELTLKVRQEREAIERQQILVKDLTIKEAQLARQITSASDKLARLQEGQNEHRQLMSTRLQALHDEYQGVADERSRIAVRIDANEKTIKDFEGRIADLARSHEAEVSAMRTDCVSLKGRVMAYTAEIKKHLQRRGELVMSDAVN